MKQIRNILFFCMIFVGTDGYCQTSPGILAGIPGQKAAVAHSNFIPFNSQFCPIPANFSSTQLGFFCKKEWKFESATKIPLKFRIGNLQCCDWLEGKFKK